MSSHDYKSKPMARNEAMKTLREIMTGDSPKILMEMSCANCNYDKPLKAKRIKTKYEASGLDYVTIGGVLEFKCPKCGETYRYYGDIEKINEEIAKYIAAKDGLLVGQEIRFIRKYLGYNTKMFATEILKIDQSTLSRIENDKSQHSETIDNFIKFLAVSKNPDRDYAAHEILLKKHSPFKNLLVHQIKGAWQIKAFA